MGVQGLWALLSKKHAEVFKDVGDLSAHRGQVFGIDTSIYMHRLCLEDPTRAPVMAFLEQAREIQAAGVTPVYIFDGKRGPIKQHEHARRREQKERMLEQAEQRKEFLERVEKLDGIINEETLREAVAEKAPVDVKRALTCSKVVEVAGLGEITVETSPEEVVKEIRQRHVRDEAAVHYIPDSHYHELMQMLDEHGIGYYIAKSEAEKLGAQLTRSGKIDVFVTDDGDALPFGAKRILRNLFRSGKTGMQFVDIADVLRALDLTREQFVDVCVISGCDFTQSRGIPSLGPGKAIKVVKKHGSLAAYMDSQDWQSKLAWIANSRYSFDVEHFQHAAAREMFMGDECQIAYVSHALDPTAEPMEFRSKRRKLSEPCF